MMTPPSVRGALAELLGGSELKGPVGSVLEQQVRGFLPSLIASCRGVKLIFTGGHISFMVAFKGLNVVLGLYKCNYSLTVQ